MEREFIFGSAADSFLRDYRTGIRRTQMYFCRTSGVPRAEYHALLQGFRRMMTETRTNLMAVDYGNYSNPGDFGSPDWYQHRAMTGKDRGLGKQVGAIELDALLRDEPYQARNPHFDVFIVDRDMTTSAGDMNNNYIFGYGPYPNNIISIRRFMGIKDIPLRLQCLQIIGAHEFGHNLDLVHRNFNIGKTGYKRSHCNGEAGPCLMEQVNVPQARSIEEQTKLIINRNRLLCEHCSAEQANKRARINRLAGAIIL